MVRAERGTLDESLTLRDLGKSAYTGEHRKNPDRNALAGFLKMVKDGRIPSNAYLIVESLDRLTREDIKPALSLLLSLSDHVEIVQLQPVVQIYKSSAYQTADSVRTSVRKSVL
jgi:hypothetical protein